MSATPPSASIAAATAMAALLDITESFLRMEDVAELSEAVRALRAAAAVPRSRGAERADRAERIARLTWYQRPRAAPPSTRASQRPLRRAALATRHRSRQVRLYL